MCGGKKDGRNGVNVPISFRSKKTDWVGGSGWMFVSSERGLFVWVFFAFVYHICMSLS